MLLGRCLANRGRLLLSRIWSSGQGGMQVRLAATNGCLKGANSRVCKVIADT